jgi:hypothetical protein
MVRSFKGPVIVYIDLFSAGFEGASAREPPEVAMLPVPARQQKLSKEEPNYWTS